MSANQNMGAQNYEPFKKKQIRLAEITKASTEIVKKLNMDNYAANLKALEDKINNDSFKIQIVGTFKNGKSTFINSFLGEEILPAYTLPCTAVINEVKYGEKKRAVLHFCNPITDEMRITDVPDPALAHMKKYNMKNIPPMEIPYDKMEDYVVIPVGKDQAEAIKETPFEKVELFWPMDLLKNGVEIIDTPGLNEAESRTKVTMEYLRKADAIIFLLVADKLCGQNEMEFVEYNLKGNGFDNPFFVINKFDVVRERERPTIKTFAQGKLSGYTNMGNSGFFYVSALDALDGKIDGNEQMYRSSGMPEFESRLSEFLTKEKGMSKLSQPAKEIKRILNTEALDKIIPQQRAMLESSLDDVKKRYENVKPKLKDLQTKKNNIKERLEQKIEMAIPDIKKCVTQNMSNLISSIPVWCNQCEPKTSIGLGTNEEKIKKAAKEVAAYANEKMEKYQLDWKNNTLTPLIDEKVKEVFGSIESDVAKFFGEIDSIQVEVSGQKNIKSSDVPTWQRVASVVGGLAIGNLGLAVSGGVNGLSKDLAKTIGLQAGAGAILGLLGLINPATILGVWLLGGAFGIFKGNKNAMIKIKSSVSDEMIKQLNSHKEENINSVISAASKAFEELAETVTSAVDIEIKEIEKQIQTVMNELQKGQSNVDAKKAELDDCEKEVKRLISETDDFVMDLLG